MILVIDNYDSFTFNLVHEIRAQGAVVQVVRNDTLDVAGVRGLDPSHIVISPGPGHPRDAGICCEIIRELGPRIPILGVCLGHQAIGHAFGAKINRCESLRHGEATNVYHDSTALFRGVRSPFSAGRYHSLVVEEDGLPDAFDVTAFTSDGLIMGLSHRTHPIQGVQFHPESILTPDGRTILRNFLGGERRVNADQRPPQEIQTQGDSGRDERRFVRTALDRLRRAQSLGEHEAQRMMELTLQGKFSADEMEQYLGAMAAKGTTVGELVGSVRALRTVTRPIDTRVDVVDTCGTGGDGTGTFNISTAAALLVAAAGQPVAKHGNRSSSGKTGSADVLEQLEIPLLGDDASVTESLRRHRFAFLFAPHFRPQVPGLAEARRRIQGPTLFNLAGPLCNPASPAFQVIGAFSEAAAHTIAEAASQLGTQRTFVLAGANGADELIPADGNVLFEVRDGRLTRTTLGTSQAGLSECTLSDLAGADPRCNASMIEALFAGRSGPRRDVVLMNAGLALLAANRAEDLRDGCLQCANAIDDGRASDLLHALRRRNHA